MTPTDVTLIRKSFANVLPIKTEAGLLFYERLFATAPELRPLFKGDLTMQANKLMDTLAVAVGALRDPGSLETTLADLGARHRKYGAQPQHYAKVGDALIWTLEKGLGPKFDAPTRAAWIALYAFVSMKMDPRVNSVKAA